MKRLCAQLQIEFENDFSNTFSTLQATISKNLDPLQVIGFCNDLLSDVVAVKNPRYVEQDVSKTVKKYTAWIKSRI